MFNIRANTSFTDILAARFLKRYADRPEELARVLFLLPNRRACLNLKEAFIRLRGLNPTILPRMEPVADLEEEEIFLTADAKILQNLPPAVSLTERIFIFIKLILQKPDLGLKRITLTQAYALAQNLAQLIDTAKAENLDFSRLADLVPDEYAEHWQQTLKLLQIITLHWPSILQEKNMLDTIERRIMLSRIQLKLWQQNNNFSQIILAGVTAAYPYLKEMTKVIADLHNGEVYLYGLDKYCDDDTWAQIDENHPQFELKELLDFLKVERRTIIDIPDAPPAPSEIFASEIMRPATSTDKWRKLSFKILPPEAFNHIRLINCDDSRHEARTIALIMRHTLEQKEKTAALITLDRNLARRVVSELKRWDIIADDSAGQPLSLTPIGIYLRLILDVIENKNQTTVISLLKHPFTSLGINRGLCSTLTHKLEYCWRRQKQPDEELNNFLASLDLQLEPLKFLYETPSVRLSDIFTAHIKVAESLADTDTKSGDKNIWKGDAGQAAAKFVSDFLLHSDILDSISTADYSGFLTTLLSRQNVRKSYGTHPRIKILGPIEARLCHYDVTIIGSANEGIWPKLPNADMWMSRPMKHDFGMLQPEKNIGVSAADFAHLLQAPQVYITRAQKNDGAPTNKSRWLLRLETLLQAVYTNENTDKSSPLTYDFIYDNNYAALAKNTDRRYNSAALNAPQPRPALYMRPRQLSASNIETLQRDPYTIYAKYILSLYPLSGLDTPKQPYDFGNLVHAVLQEFNNLYPQEYPANAANLLTDIGRQHFIDADISPDVQVFWWPKFMEIINWTVKTEQAYRPTVSQVHNEIYGQITYDAPGGPFKITAIADRVDETTDGKISIIDYKTGKTRSIKEMTDGKAPQLPIEGIIAEKGGFKDIKAKKVQSLQYWGFQKKAITTSAQESETAITRTDKIINALICAFDDEKRPYLAKPFGNKSGVYSDYDHLSRFAEWAVKDNSTSEETSDD